LSRSDYVLCDIQSMRALKPNSGARAAVVCEIVQRRGALLWISDPIDSMTAVPFVRADNYVQNLLRRGSSIAFCSVFLIAPAIRLVRKPSDLVAALLGCGSRVERGYDFQVVSGTILDRKASRSTASPVSVCTRPHRQVLAVRQ